MQFKTAFAALLIALGFIASGGTAFGQELPRAYGELGAIDKGLIPAQLQLRRPSLSANGTLSYTPPPAACVCTNLGNVSVICADCDSETRVDYCHTHDRACQDAAQTGGIREHNTFFCTTASQ